MSVIIRVEIAETWSVRSRRYDVKAINNRVMSLAAKLISAEDLIVVGLSR